MSRSVRMLISQGADWDGVGWLGFVADFLSRIACVRGIFNVWSLEMRFLIGYKYFDRDLFIDGLKYLAMFAEKSIFQIN